MKKYLSGFTLVETVLVLGIVAILMAFGFTSLGNFRSGFSVDEEARLISEMIRAAQTKSAIREGGHRFGVHFNNPSGSRGTYTIFRVDEVLFGQTNFPVEEAGILEIRTLSSNLAFTDPVENSSSSIIFTKGTGNPISTLSVSLQSTVKQDETATITVNSAGFVDY